MGEMATAGSCQNSTRLLEAAGTRGMGVCARGEGIFGEVCIRLDNSRLRGIFGRIGSERMSPGVGTGYFLGGM